jgi:hypothetical protein
MTVRTKYNADTSPLLRLPGEIRNKIYSYVFTGIKSTGKTEYSKRYSGIALLHTCRQIRQEAKSFPTKSNFHLFINATPKLTLLRHLDYMSNVTTVQIETWGFQWWSCDYGCAATSLEEDLDFLAELPRVDYIEVFGTFAAGNVRVASKPWLERGRSCLEEAISRQRPGATVEFRTHAIHWV